MNMAILGATISFLLLAVAIFSTYWLRRLKRVYITDYQVGLRLQSGTEYAVLPPGGYLTRDNRNPISVVDMRPHPFIFERMGYKDSLLRNFVISIGGELVVRDPTIAMTKLKSLVDDAMTVVREELRVAASHSIADPSREARSKMASAFASEINRNLKVRGVGVQNLEITELWAPPFKSGNSATAN